MIKNLTILELLERYKSFAAVGHIYIYIQLVNKVPLSTASSPPSQKPLI
jgi:hypothetical protein